MWDERFLDLATHVAGWSKDPSTQVGAVITRPDRTIASLGYNGFPRGADDSPELYADRTIKYARVVHAEMNAILHAREPMHGYTLYLTHPTCSTCAGCVIQTGIERIVCRHSQGFLARWGDAWKVALQMYSEAGVTVSLL